MLTPQVVLLFFAMASRPSSPATLSDNAAEFTALCRIFRTAVEGSESVPDGWLKQLDPQNRVSSRRRMPEDLLRDLNVTHEGKQVVDLDGNPIGVKPSRYTKLQVAKLGKVIGRIESLKQEESKVYKQLGQEITTMKSAFAKVVNGSEDQKYGDTTLSSVSARADACKAASGSAGKSIKVDLACLCVRTNAKNGHCGFDVGSGEWGSSGQAHATGGWTTIHDECWKQKMKIGLQPVSIERALENFEGLLGRQGSSETDGTAVVRYVLGKPTANHNSNACGANSQNAACVDYRTSGGERAQIQWEEDMKAANEELKQVLSKIENMKEIQRKIDDLDEEAVVIFNETLLEAEIDKEPTNTEDITGGTKAKNSATSDTTESSGNKLVAAEKGTKESIKKSPVFLAMLLV